MSEGSSRAAETTAPKPFVFVLMPFDCAFDDIYRFGIKGAADAVGAYAERVDEQVFSEGILDRVFNQISKADVIVADMTGRNPNVFYEVGYAHALGKVVLLLTQNADDIPFDLKHRQHTVYAGSIEALKGELQPKLTWALSESQRMKQGVLPESISVRLNEVPLARGLASETAPKIAGTVKQSWFHIPIHLRNDSLEPLRGITHVYLFAEKDAVMVPCSPPTTELPAHESSPLSVSSWVTGVARKEPTPLENFVASAIDAPDGLTRQYRLRTSFPALPPGAIEKAGFEMMFATKAKEAEGRYRLRLHSHREYFEFPFSLSIKLNDTALAAEAQRGVPAAKASGKKKGRAG